MDDVPLAEGGGNLVDDLHPDALDAHLGVAVVRHGVGRDDGLGEGSHLFFHYHVERAVVVDFQRKMHVLKGISA